MRRLVVLLSLCAGFGALGMTSLVACGGNDKPPLTPDTVDPSGSSGSSGDGAGSDAGAAPATPAMTANPTK